MTRTTEVQLTLRFSEALRAKLEKEARRNNRSLNTEIVYRLENWDAVNHLNTLRAMIMMIGTGHTLGATGKPPTPDQMNKMLATIDSMDLTKLLAEGGKDEGTH